MAGNGADVPADRLSLRVTNQLSEIPRLAGLVLAFCAAQGLPEAVAFRFNLAFEEILTNTIKYGYDAAGPREIAIELRREAGRVVAEVTDDARPFDPTRAPPPDLDGTLEERAIGGLGLYLISQMLDEVAYRRDGAHNRLTLVKNLS